MRLTLNTNREGIVFNNSSTLAEDILKNDILTIIGSYDYESRLRWERVSQDVTNGFYGTDLYENPMIETLIKWGVDIENIKEIQPVLNAKYKQYQKQNQPIAEYMQTDDFKKAREQVKACYPKFSDGSKLFPYQIDGAALIVGRRRLLNGMDTGTGKTITTLVGLTSDPRNKKILIVTMRRNFVDWKREIKKIGFEDDYIVLNSPKDMKSEKRIHLVSYEKWAQEKVYFAKDDAGKSYSDKNLPAYCPECEEEWKKGSYTCSCGFSVISKRKKPLYKYFNRSYDAAAIDEGQFIKNGSTQRTKSIMAIKTKTRVLLSGTPAENGAGDLFWLLAWLMGDSLIFKDSGGHLMKAREESNRRFHISYGGVNLTNLLDSDRITSRVSNKEKLWSLLDRIMYRKLKTDADVARSILVPEPTHRRLHLEMTDSERKLYEKRVSEFNEWYQNEKAKKKKAEYKGETYHISTIEVCSWLDKLRKIASCPWVQDDYEVSVTPPSKLTFVRDKIRELAMQKKKLLIFTAHKQTAEQLGTLLDEYVPGYQAAYIHGEVPMDYRESLMSRFQDPNDNLSVLVMTMKTGGESYTLTEAKAVILYDLDFNAKKIQQCYSRAVRLGQKEVVEITWLISVDSIDANMHALVLSKQSGVDIAIDRQELDFEKIAEEFDGEMASSSGAVDYQAFASEMLSRGIKRSDYQTA